MTKFHYRLTTTEKVMEYGGMVVYSGFWLEDGRYVAHVEFDDADFDLDYVNSCLEEEATVLEYSSEPV